MSSFLCSSLSSSSLELEPTSDPSTIGWDGRVHIRNSASGIIILGHTVVFIIAVSNTVIIDDLVVDILDNETMGADF